MLTGVLVVLAGLGALLAIPITVRYQIAWPMPAEPNEINLRWAFGLVRFSVPTQYSRAPRPREIDTKREEASRPTSSRRSGLDVWRALQDESLRKRVMRYISRLWRAARKQDVRMRLRVGLGDPADTGFLWSVLGPATVFLAAVPGASINVEPEFVDAALEFESSGGIQIIPLQIIYLTLTLLLAPSVWRVLRQLRKTH